MCNKCEELDKRITHHRRFVTGYLLDVVTHERISGLIRDLERQKEALHSAPSSRAEATVALYLRC
jgi:hypothetical protein